MRGAGEELLQLVPASSEVVVTAYLDPSAGQKVNLMALAHRFPALSDDQQLGARGRQALDEALADAGLDPRGRAPMARLAGSGRRGSRAERRGHDVGSHLDHGRRGRGRRPGQGSPELARQRGDARVRGVTMHVFGAEPSMMIYAIVDHVVVLSDHPNGITAVIDASNGTTPAIADDPAFVDTTSSLPQASSRWRT